MSIRKVIIFDSGVGGLSIWQEVHQYMPNVECHYLFDNAYFPYGELDEAFLIERVCQLVPKLVEQTKANAVVIACNTASTAALVQLRSMLSIPVVGVVPAIKPAAALSLSKHIAVLATPATVNRPYTHQLARDFASDCHVIWVGSSFLVKMAEEYLLTQTVNEQRLKAELVKISETKAVDAVVLGCTHFPLIREAIAARLDPKIKLVDSGKAIARQLARILSDGERSERSSKHRYYYTKSHHALTGVEQIFEKFEIKKGQLFCAAPEY